eukprot:11312589-Ditylum_brightwellii.AAC.1
MASLKPLGKCRFCQDQPSNKGCQSEIGSMQLQLGQVQAKRPALDDMSVQVASQHDKAASSAHSQSTPGAPPHS